MPSRMATLSSWLPAVMATHSRSRTLMSAAMEVLLTLTVSLAQFYVTLYGVIGWYVCACWVSRIRMRSGDKTRESLFHRGIPPPPALFVLSNHPTLVKLTCHPFPCAKSSRHQNSLIEQLSTCKGLHQLPCTDYMVLLNHPRSIAWMSL